VTSFTPDDAVVVIDVRTPEEYAAGHLQSAVNIDISDDVAFAIELVPYPHDGTYLLYCRSGQRAETAKAVMEMINYTDVTNLGSLENAADYTGLPIVK